MASGEIKVNGKVIGTVIGTVIGKCEPYTGPIHEIVEYEPTIWPLYQCDDCKEEWMFSTSKDCLHCGSVRISKLA